MILERLNKRISKFFEFDDEDDNDVLINPDFNSIFEDDDEYEMNIDPDFNFIFEDDDDEEFFDFGPIDSGYVYGRGFVNLHNEDSSIEEVIVTKKTKRDEVLESLQYLKSKPSKTKQDNESIYTLEMVLRNLK